MWCSECEMNSILISWFLCLFTAPFPCVLEVFNKGNGVPPRNNHRRATNDINVVIYYLDGSSKNDRPNSYN